MLNAQYIILVFRIVITHKGVIIIITIIGNGMNVIPILPTMGLLWKMRDVL